MALRRSKAFLLQHLMAFALLLMPIYTIVLAATQIMVSFSHKLVPFALVRVIFIPVAAALIFIFSDNLLRASAALMAEDERIRVRRFLSFRVFLETDQDAAGSGEDAGAGNRFHRAWMDHWRLSMAGDLRGGKTIRKRRAAAIERVNDGAAIGGAGLSRFATSHWRYSRWRTL